MCRENTHDIGEVRRLLGVTSRTLRSQARAPENGATVQYRICVRLDSEERELEGQRKKEELSRFK